MIPPYRSVPPIQQIACKKKAPEGALGLLLFLLRQNECCTPTPKVVTSVPGERPPLVPLPTLAAGPAM